MKKTTTIVKEKSTFEISVLINNIAYIKSVTGKTGLLNIKTNQLLCPLDYYHAIYEEKAGFYILERPLPSDIELPASKQRKQISIYDCRRETFILENWEVVKKQDRYYRLVLLSSPKDGKTYLLDRGTCRNQINIFNKPIEETNFFYEHYDEDYYILTSNGKKALYLRGKGLCTAFEFDAIEKYQNTIIYTQKGKKYFVVDGDNGMKSPMFDSITMEKNKNGIVYGRIGNTIYVYSTTLQELLMKKDVDEVTFSHHDDSNSYNDYGEFFFFIKKDGKVGVSSSIYTSAQKESKSNAIVNDLLPIEYDSIEYGSCAGGSFYMKKGGLEGIFKGTVEENQKIDPNYDEIRYISNGDYALVKNGVCDIGPITSHTPFKAEVSNCQIISEKDYVLIYKQNDLYGLIIYKESSSYVIPAIYESVEHITKGYYIVTKNGKKGVLHYKKEIIPCEYDTITYGNIYNDACFNKEQNVYFGLQKQTHFELAKRKNYDYESEYAPTEFVNNQTFTSVEFFYDIMVFKDGNYCYIYNYEEKLLKTLPLDTEVEEILLSQPNDFIKKYLYNINGICYFYKAGQFEETLFEENAYFKTTFETSEDIFEIRSLNQQEHDAFVSEIDTISEADAITTLSDYAQNKNKLKEKHPTLKLTRTSKTMIPSSK